MTKILHKRSNVIENGEAKLPTPSQLDYGELAINFAAGKETMSIKNSNGEIVTFPTNSQLEEIEFVTANALNQHDIEFENISHAFSEVRETIEENEYVVASALNDLNGRIITSASQLTNDVGFLTEHQSLSQLISYANYDSNNREIRFHNLSGTVRSIIDANNFIKDGMVSSVTISNGNLVISFNTDAGREDISLALTQIFNPSNYYTKNDIDNKGYLTGYTETDPTVPSWAKNSTKPSYTANEVGALPTGTTLDSIPDGATRKLSNYSPTGHTHTALEVGALTGISINGSAATVSNGNASFNLEFLPSVSASDNGKILRVVNGQWTLVTSSTIYTGQGAPDNLLGIDGDIYLQTS